MSTILEKGVMLNERLRFEPELYMTAPTRALQQLSPSVRQGGCELPMSGDREDGEMKKYRVATTVQIVWACDQCPFARTVHGNDEYVSRCSKIGRNLLKSKKTPKWCPLPEREATQ